MACVVTEVSVEGGVVFEGVSVVVGVDVDVEGMSVVVEEWSVSSRFSSVIIVVGESIDGVVIGESGSLSRYRKTVS